MKAPKTEIAVPEVLLTKLIRAATVAEFSCLTGAMRAHNAGKIPGITPAQKKRYIDNLASEAKEHGKARMAARRLKDRGRRV